VRTPSENPSSKSWLLLWSRVIPPHANERTRPLPASRISTIGNRAASQRSSTCPRSWSREQRRRIGGASGKRKPGGGPGSLPRYDPRCGETRRQFAVERHHEGKVLLRTAEKLGQLNGVES
jgi:hypothetical protein